MGVKEEAIINILGYNRFFKIKAQNPEVKKKIKIIRNKNLLNMKASLNKL